MPHERISLGISSCLLGDPVRYDGGHKKDGFLAEVLTEFVDWIRVCPELEIGLGTPREPIRLERLRGDVRVKGTTSGADHTERMRRYAAEKSEELALRNLRGFVFKKDSPSCGLKGVRVHGNEEGEPIDDGVGLFAAALTRRVPLLPVEEEGRLSDELARENFLTRVYAYDRLLKLRGKGPSRSDLVEFHAAHKLLLLVHSPGHCRSLAAAVAAAESGPIETVLDGYGTEFMRALERAPTHGRQADMFELLAALLGADLGVSEKRELQGAIDDYRRGRAPRVVPALLLQSHFECCDSFPIEARIYLEPYPRALVPTGAKRR
jgi:uncharacterized protein YbbK (DUF523 family)/uncharacterized protein YbgA (DUF1722 family)